jgi:hypothetical protein
VLKFQGWKSVVLVGTAIMLSACGGGGGGSSGTASVRLANATTTHASIDLLANGATSVTATPVDSVSAYAGVDAAGPSLQVNDDATQAALGTIAPSLAKDGHYVLVAYESGGSLHITLVNEDIGAPAAGSASLRVIDTATDAGAIDVYVTDPATDITTLSSPSFSIASATTLQTSTFLSFAPGTYRVRVTGAGNPADLRLDVPAVVLASQEVASLLLTPSVGGTLVNGAVLAQQGAYTAAHNPNARVRLAAAVTSGATVAASAASAPIGSNVVSPSVGGYVVVPAGSALNVSVNGASVGAPAAPLVAGSDATLLVYGSAAAPTATLIADDNHLPALNTNLKIRLVNGLTGAAPPPLELDAGFAVVASNVAAGTASAYGVIGSSTSLRIDVFAPNNLLPIYTDAPAPLSVPGNAVYTLFILGDAASPTPPSLLRKDR